MWIRLGVCWSRCQVLSVFALLAAALCDARRVITSANLWARQPALTLLNHQLAVELGVGVLRPATFAQLLHSRSTILDALEGCIGSSCASMIASPSVTAASETESKWSREARARREAAAAVAAAASELKAAVEAEGLAGAAWSGASRSGALVEDGEASAAALRLARHLQSAEGCLAQLGAAMPLLRMGSFVFAGLLATDLDGGDDPGQAACIRHHADRWGDLAQLNGAAFDRARDALDAGVVSLSFGGALSDVECGAALREAQTTATLLLEWADATAQEAATGASLKPAALQAAREAIEAVEPGFAAAQQAREFVTGYGMLDTDARRAANRNAAASYSAAKAARQCAVPVTRRETPLSQSVVTLSNAR